MNQVSSGFENGTNGAAIVTGGAGDPTPWDTVVLGTGGAVTYDNAQAHRGILSGLLFRGSAGSAYIEWVAALGGTITDHYGRAYVYLTGNPGSIFALIQILSGASNAAQIRLAPGGILQTRDSIGTATNGTVVVPLNQWFRIGWHIVHSATVGIIEYKLFTNPDSNVPAETITATGLNTLASGDRVRFYSDANISYSVRLDDLVAGATGYLGPALPNNTVAPSVTGTTVVGQTLSCSQGTWQAVQGANYAYQWQRDNFGGGIFVNISAATLSTYTLVNGDEGRSIRCVVTATNGGGATSANSNGTALITQPVPVNTVAPSISGTPQVGQVLTCLPGTWTPSGVPLTYQWQRDIGGNNVFSNIVGQTTNTHSLAEVDGLCKVRCVVTATNSAGSVSANSNAPLISILPPLLAAGGFAKALYEQMQPLAYDDETYGWALILYLDGVGQMLEELDWLSHSDPPWEPILDIDLVPDAALQWLAQFVGAILDATLSYDDQRQQIRDHIGWNRGTPATFKSMAQARLTGTKTLQLDERIPDAYGFRVITWANETPPADWPVRNLIANPSFETNTTGWNVAP